MYYYIEGTVAYALQSAVVIDCSGVGYRLSVSSNTLTQARVGAKLRLFTHLYVREDAVELFGFADLKEKNSFLMLIDISGVGPKAAMAILSVTTPDRFALGVINGDEKMLTRAQGVGKKLAQRIILELKDKLAKSMGEELEELAGSLGEEPVAVMSGNKEAAVSALIVLGYSRPEAQKAVASVTDAEGKSTEEIIRLALKNT
ncbi:MAG: Holliday junction branch migration protein RuvA [Ruminococcaceae bacterium]|nr:Holliday junction branch migration protein RuvA [Oscillospiraceae bacterium]